MSKPTSPLRFEPLFEPMRAAHRFWLTLAAIVVLGLGVTRFSTAQQGPVPAGWGASDPSQGKLLVNDKGVRVLDLTPRDQVWPRYHLIYNFDRGNATFAVIDEDGVQVRSITRLDRVSK